MWVVCGPGSKAARPASQRIPGARSVACSCSFMPIPPRSRWAHLPKAQSRQRKPTILTLRWWSETEGWSAVGARAAESSHACSPTAECQTNLVLSVRSAIFPSDGMERQRNAAVGKWPCSRLMLVSCTGRSLAVLLLCPRRQAEPRAVLLMPCPRATTRGLLLAGRTMSRGLWNLKFSGAHDLFLTVSAVCGRRNAARAFRVICEADRGSGVERVQSWRVSHRARAEP